MELSKFEAAEIQIKYAVYLFIEKQSQQKSPKHCFRLLFLVLVTFELLVE